MKVIEINEGRKIEFEVNDTKITFADELMLNLAKYQNENDVSIDICFDALGNLTNKVTENGSYVAQILIPGYEYSIQETENEDIQDEEISKLPLNMEKVLISLWSVE